MIVLLNIITAIYVTYIAIKVLFFEDKQEYED